MKRIITITVISIVLLFLSSCIFFQTINQPSVSAPNEIVSVTIIANTQGGGYEPYFGVCLPVGWTVLGDSIQCGGAYEEVIHYDTLVTFNQESVSPAPSGYYWWAGKGIPDETAVGNVFANLKIQTDSQLGEFSIDYMLGDGYNGVNYERSNDHLIEITTEPLILFVNPEEGYQNFSVDMNILGLNTHFSDGTGTEDVWLSKNNDEIHANSFIVNSNTSIDANFTIPLTADTGLWDVNVETDIDGIVTKAEGFNILPSPPLIVVSPDSLVVGVLPGSTRTKTLTIGNEGESNLYFNLKSGLGSVHFNGIDGYIQVLNNPSLDLHTEITIAAWIKFETGGENGHARIISKGADGAGYEIKMLWDNGGIRNLQFLVGPGSVFSKTEILAEQWYHLAATYDGSQIDLYLNGNLDTSVVATGAINITTEDLFFGQKSSWNYDKYKGILDDLSLWQIALSQNEIQDLMNVELTGTEFGLVGYWQFNEGAGVTAYDKTVNANHGNLFGGVTWTNFSAPVLPDWFQMSIDSGVCLPHTSMDVELLFDATEVDTGDYYASVIIYSNDPVTPTVVVPIHMIVSTSVGVDDGINPPMVFNLEQNYPNPFNPSTRIKYSIPELSKVRLTLFNLLGEEVTTLVNEEKIAGNYSVEFNATSLPSGVYFYQLKAGEYISTKKMILLK